MPEKAQLGTQPQLHLFVVGGVDGTDLQQSHSDFQRKLTGRYGEERMGLHAA